MPLYEVADVEGVVMYSLRGEACHCRCCCSIVFHVSRRCDRERDVAQR